MKNILITGGAGFIGSHLVKYKNYNIINLDKLTYASNISFLDEIKNFENYFFVQADICDLEQIQEIYNKYKISNELGWKPKTSISLGLKKKLIGI